MPTLPSDFKLILMGAVSISGIMLYFYGKKIMAWLNEYKNAADSKAVSAARTEADTSDQDLNDQTSRLPKE